MEAVGGSSAERRSGRDDRWLDRTQLAILANQGVLQSQDGERDLAEGSLTRARDLARKVADATDATEDWLRHARVAQELANVHMDTPGNAHSIGVLEASIALADELEARLGPLPELASERDWQRVSLTTQYLQNGDEAKAHAVLRRMLQPPIQDPELAAQLALVAAYAIRVGHPDVDTDRQLCRTWVARAVALDPTFAAGVEAGGEPWKRLITGD